MSNNNTLAEIGQVDNVTVEVGKHTIVDGWEDVITNYISVRWLESLLQEDNLARALISEVPTERRAAELFYRLIEKEKAK